MANRLGVICRPDFHPDGLRDVASSAQSAGVDELWFWEDCFQQGGIAQTAVALASTERLSVGIGLVPAPLRNVTAAAMEFATLDAMFPGRVQIAVGHGVQSWMRQAGAAVASPMTLLREYVTALRALLSGAEVTVDGRYIRLSQVRLQFPPARPLPVLVGGTGPKTLRLAGEIADGVLVDSRYTTATVREALEHVAQGRAEAGIDPFGTTLFLACAPGEDPLPRLAAEASRQGVPDVGVFGVGGTAGQIADGFAPYRDAGVDAIALQPLGHRATWPTSSLRRATSVRLPAAAMNDDDLRLLLNGRRVGSDLTVARTTALGRRTHIGAGERARRSSRSGDDRDRRTPRH